MRKEVWLAVAALTLGGFVEWTTRQRIHSAELRAKVEAQDSAATALAERVVRETAALRTEVRSSHRRIAELEQVVARAAKASEEALQVSERASSAVSRLTPEDLQATPPAVRETLSQLTVANVQLTEALAGERKLNEKLIREVHEGTAATLQALALLDSAQRVIASKDTTISTLQELIPSSRGWKSYVVDAGKVLAGLGLAIIFIGRE